MLKIGNAKGVEEITFIADTINTCGYTKILADIMTPETWQNRIFKAGFMYSRHMEHTLMLKLCKTYYLNEQFLKYWAET